MQIVHGDPTPEEVAALVVVLTQLRSVHDHRWGVETGRRSTWSWRRSEPVDRNSRWRDWSSDWREITPPTPRPARRSDRSWDRRVV